MAKRKSGINMLYQNLEALQQTDISGKGLGVRYRCRERWEEKKWKENEHEEGAIFTSHGGWEGRSSCSMKYKDTPHSLTIVRGNPGIT